MVLFLLFFLGSITHESLGIYAGKLNAWTNAGRYTRDIELPKPKPKSIKNPEIPVLKGYYILKTIFCLN